MESEDIEDGEILEDESNPGEDQCVLADVGKQPEEKNDFEKFFGKEKKNHHHHHHHHHRPHDHPTESRKSFRRADRSSFLPNVKKRKRSDEDGYRSEKYYGKVSCRFVGK